MNLINEYKNAEGKENAMKILTAFQSIGYLALFLASVFNFINQINEKQIFGLAVTIPLFIIGGLGIGCGITRLIKNKKNKKT